MSDIFSFRYLCLIGPKFGDNYKNIFLTEKVKLLLLARFITNLDLLWFYKLLLWKFFQACTRGEQTEGSTVLLILFYNPSPQHIFFPWSF